MKNLPEIDVKVILPSEQFKLMGLNYVFVVDEYHYILMNT